MAPLESTVGARFDPRSREGATAQHGPGIGATRVCVRSGRSL